MQPRSLSATQAKIVLALEEAGVEDVTLDAIQRLTNVKRGYARKLAHGLTAKGWLQRVARGRYLLNPSAYGPDAVPETDPLRIGSRLVSPYYFGFATAAELWGLLLQPGRTYFVVTTRRVAFSAHGPAQFRFVRVLPKRFFGTTTLRRRGQLLQLSDPERTVLDCLRRPAFSGGITGAVQVLARAKPRLAWGRLDRYLRRLDDRSLGARLGFLADHVTPSSDLPDRWRRRMLPARSDPWVPLGSLDDYGRTGPKDPTWRVVRNVPDRELFAEVEHR